MQTELLSILELCRDPMLLVEDGKITYLNASAEKLFFPQHLLQRSVAGLIPDYILFDPAKKFVSSARIADVQYTVSAQREGNALLLSLAPTAAPQQRSLLSDGLMMQMLSTLFNVGISAKNISEKFAAHSDPDLKQQLRILQHSYYALDHQLTNLNTAMLMQENALFFAPVAVDLVKLIGELAATVTALTYENHAQIEFSTDLDELIAEVDALLISRLLLNLLANSLQHTSKSSIIHVKLMQSAANAVLSVSDNGSGIAGNVLQNIFTRYESRIDGSDLSGDISGGLGLGIARGIAQKHGGALIIESREGEGTHVRVMLPLKQPGRTVLKEPELTPCPEMDLILTELADVLGADCYGPELMD